MKVFQNQIVFALLTVAFFILAMTSFVYLLAYPKDSISPALRIGTIIGNFVMCWAGVVRIRASRIH